MSRAPSPDGLVWQPLDSHSIRAVAYDRNTFSLYVEFKSGDVWVYKDVDKRKYKTVIYASSSGSYLRNSIIPKHDGERVRGKDSPSVADAGD